MSFTTSYPISDHIYPKVSTKTLDSWDASDRFWLCATIIHFAHLSSIIQYVHSDAHCPKSEYNANLEAMLHVHRGPCPLCCCMQHTSYVGVSYTVGKLSSSTFQCRGKFGKGRRTRTCIHVHVMGATGAFFWDLPFWIPLCQCTY